MDESQALSLARAAYTSSTTWFDSSVRRLLEEDLRRFKGLHPAGSKYYSDNYRARSRLFRPKTRAAIRKNEAVAAEAFFSTVDVTSVTPQDDTDEIQRASADVMKEILQYRLKKSIPWFLICLGAYQEAQNVGVVISRQDWVFDPEKGIDQPTITLIAPENFRIDPASNWADPIGTSPYLIELMPMYIKDVKARMKPDRKTNQPKWRTLEASVLSTAARKMSDSIAMLREEPGVDRTDQPNEVTDYSIVWVHRNVVEDGGLDWMYYTLATEHLLSKPVPLRSSYAHGKRPYVMGMCALEAHRLYPGGVSRLGKDVQSEVNEIANQRLDNVKFAMNKRYFVKRGRQVDLRSLQRNVPSSVTLMEDPASDVEIVNTPDVTSSAYAEQDRLNVDFDEVAGVFSGSSVASNRKLNETVGGMQLLTAGSNQVSAYQLLTFVESWAEPALRQVALLEQQYETDEVILALAARKARLFQRFGQDVSIDELLRHELTVNVDIGMGATNPAAKVDNILKGISAIATTASSGLERYGLKIAEVIKEIFGLLGYKDGDRFFDTEVDPGVRALLDKVKQLEDALQQKQPPELIAAQIEHLRADSEALRARKLETTVKSEYAAIQTGQVIAANPMVAPIADKVLEAGGFQYAKPAGIDPNLPATAQMAAASTDAEPVVVPAEQNTNPMYPPVPQGGEEGAYEGIETQRADGLTA